MVKAAGLIISAVGLVLTLWSAVLVMRIKPEDFDNGASFGDFGGGPKIAQYIRLTEWPTRCLIAAAVLQLVGLVTLALAD